MYIIHSVEDWYLQIKCSTVLSPISAPCACEIANWWSRCLELVLSFPTLVSDWKSDYFWPSYGHLCKKCSNFYKKRLYLCKKWSDFQSETTVGKLWMSPFSSQKHGGALIRAGALNGDNTVLVILYSVPFFPLHFEKWSNIKKKHWFFFQRYYPSRDEWEIVSHTSLSAFRFVVSDEDNIYFYNLEDGSAQVMK